jgi:hypothetical protein
MLATTRPYARLLLATLLVALGVQHAGAEVKRARAGDLASEYELDGRGNFYRIVDGRRCQITNGVAEFKISTNPADIATSYFMRNGTLFGVYNAELSPSGNCPKARTDHLLDGVAKFSVVSGNATTIVSMAQSRDGELVAFGPSSVAFRIGGVADYAVNGRYAVKGAPFSRYVAFAINASGWILKIDGRDPAASKWDSSRTYPSIAAFRSANGIR